MTSIVQTIQKKTTKQATLPLSTPSDDNQPGLRRRLSSLSLNLHPSSISSSQAATWAIHRSKSLSSMGEHAGNSIKSWWAWGLGWIMSMKPGFAKDLEMNEEEKHVLGFHNRGSLMHVFYKAKNDVKKMFRYDDMVLPQTTAARYKTKRGGL